MTEAFVNDTQRKRALEGKPQMDTPKLRKMEDAQQGIVHCFQSCHDILSNSYRSPFVFEEVKYFNVAQAFQHRKALFYDESDIAAAILRMPRSQCESAKIQTDIQWEHCRVDIMRKLLRAKYDACPAYRKKLSASPGTIVESLRGDLFWTAGVSKEEALVGDDWLGKNMTGNLHMEIREEKKDSALGKCNWCGLLKELLPTKKFCGPCGSTGQECMHCHRPMPSTKFELSSRLCNACFRKHEKQKKARRERNALKHSFVFRLAADE